MINSKDELKQYIKMEKKIYFPQGGIALPFGMREKDILFSYVRCLRKTEYHINCKHKVRAFFYKIILNNMQNKYCLHIPENTCGKGLSIAHVGPIIIHKDSKVGENLRIHVGVNIGANDGNTPRIGDDVYIGPGAKIFGDIAIADKCKIGANAVVNKSCHKVGSTLVGIPAKILG